jgi:hypothetical protein
MCELSRQLAARAKIVSGASRFVSEVWANVDAVSNEKARAEMAGRNENHRDLWRDNAICSVERHWTGASTEAAPF